MRALLPILTLAACTGEVPDVERACEDDVEADEYHAGLERSGEAFGVQFIDAEPAPPDVGINVWNVEVAEGEALVEEADVQVFPWMPLHGHGTVPARHEMTLAEDGTWFSRPINLFMPGLWVITFEVDDGVLADEVEFRFCLEG